MPVQKYRDVGLMPRPPRVGTDDLYDRVSRLWEMATRMAPLTVVPGVQKFHTIEQANTARERATLQRMRAMRGHE